MTLSTFLLIDSKLIEFYSSASSLDEVTATLPDAFYTTFSTLAAGEKVLGLKKHLQRLYAPAHQIKLKPSADEKTLREKIYLLTRTMLPNESRLRLLLIKETGYVYIAIQPFQPLPDSIYKNGVHVITSQLTRHNPRIKGTDFIAQSQAQRKLINKKTFEVLLTKNGKVSEGMTSNFYIVTKPNKVLVTAQRGILLGVTRRSVLKLAKQQGLQIEYRAPALNEKFDEAFLTSSSRGVVPIVSIDNKPVGNGKVGKHTKQLILAYQNYVQAQAENLILDNK